MKVEKINIVCDHFNLFINELKDVIEEEYHFHNRHMEFIDENSYLLVYECFYARSKVTLANFILIKKEDSNKISMDIVSGGDMVTHQMKYFDVTYLEMKKIIHFIDAILEKNKWTFETINPEYFDSKKSLGGLF